MFFIMSRRVFSHLKDWIKEDDSLPDQTRKAVACQAEATHDLRVIANLANHRVDQRPAETGALTGCASVTSRERLSTLLMSVIRDGVGPREPQRDVMRWLTQVATAGTVALLLAAAAARPVQAEVYGPISPLAPSDPVARVGDGADRWWSRPVGPSMRHEYQRSRGARAWSDVVDDEEMIERVSGEDKGPRIPEPMVFDLVRPLGAKRGEGEVNILGIVPLARTSRTVDDAADPLGLVRRSPDTQGLEWAPEIEYTVRDGLALEFELPMENATVEAYKAAGQVSFGTLFEHRYIHGLQVIGQYDRNAGLWTTTYLYLAGVRVNETWSVFGMFGPRFEHGAQIGGRNTEVLANVTLFADVTDRIVMGVETNFGQVLNGSPALLVMPQLHYEVGSHWMLQVGVGVRRTDDLTLPEAGFRLIREF